MRRRSDQWQLSVERGGRVGAGSAAESRIERLCTSTLQLLSRLLLLMVRLGFCFFFFFSPAAVRFFRLIRRLSARHHSAERFRNQQPTILVAPSTAVSPHQLRGMGTRWAAIDVRSKSVCTILQSRSPAPL